MTGFHVPKARFPYIAPKGGKSNKTLLCLLYPDTFLTLTDFILELDLADFTRSVAVGFFFPGERLIMRHFATCEPRGRPGHVGDIDEGAAAADHYGNRNAVAIVCL